MIINPQPKIQTHRITHYELRINKEGFVKWKYNIISITVPT